MAERTQRISDREDIAADDPFAELTRIMGFDPRVPVRPQDASQAKADSADDFAIDLEKELMGEFGASDEADAADAQAAQIGASPSDPRYLVEGDAAAASEFDDDIEAALDQEFQFAEDVALDEPELAGEVESTFEERQVSAANEKVEDFELESGARGFSEQEDEEFGGFDAVDFELVEAGEEDVAPAGGASASDFDADFDRAMADVDMDFDARPEEASAPYEPETELPRFVSHAVADEAVDEIAPVSNEADAVVPLAVVEDDFAGRSAVEQVAQPFDQAVADPAGHDDSLEDELNALLNQMSARPLPVEKSVADWAPSNQQVDAESHAEADDVDWQPEEAPVAAQEEPAGYAAFDHYNTESLEEPEAIEAAGEPVEDEIDFDQSAFEAAMVADGEPEVVEEVAPASESEAPVAEDPIEALQWLAGKPIADAVAPSRAWSRGTPYIQPQRPAQQPVADAGPVEPEAFSASQPAYEASVAYDVAFDAAEPAISSEAEAEVVEAAEPVTASAAPAQDEIPDIETVDVPERVVALADDLDIPDVPFESEKAEKPLYDDLEVEFTSLLTEMNASEPASVAAQPAAYDDAAYGAEFRQVPASAPDYAKPHQAQVAAARSDYDDPALAGFDIDNLPGSKPLDGRDAIGDDDLAFDPDFDEEMSLPDPAEAAAARQPRSRVVMVGALVGAVALIGGIGAFALSFGGSDSAGTPVLVQADDNPIKVKPENPGGTVIPNQDNKVYDMVAKGAKPAAPEQEKLVTDAEEPVDIAAKAPEARVVEPAPAEAETDIAAAQPSGKSEERIAPAAVEPAAVNDSEVALVTPRKVRTMIVRPDGSLVPREEPQPVPAQVAATEPADPAPQLVVNPTADEQTGAVSAATETQADQAPVPAVAPATAAPAPTTATAQPQAADTQSASTPALAPVAPQRPAEQPVDIVGEVKPDQVAAVDPAGAVAASGAWSMQIASQPSVESAQSTYQDLARRYSSVLEGRSVNIVKAEVAGKGTFYRVRVAVSSRNEAVSLCESYKAAGGNCFVSK